MRKLLFLPLLVALVAILIRYALVPEDHENGDQTQKGSDQRVKLYKCGEGPIPYDSAYDSQIDTIVFSDDVNYASISCACD